MRAPTRLILCLCLVLQAATASAKSFPWRSYAKRPDSWFQEPEAATIARHVLSYQSDAGSWPKNIDTGESSYKGDRTKLEGTFDNGATMGELRFLAKMVEATGTEAYRSAFLKGLDHVLAAQYPTGGWPQFAPPGQKYHRHITFNDGTMVKVLEFVRDVARDPVFSFVEDQKRQAARRAFDAGVRCIVACQVVVNGEKTVWCAQHDEVTLEPRPGRAYEHVSLSGAESSGILTLLMSLERPGPDVREAIEAGVRWYASARLTGIRVERGEGGTKVVSDPSASPLWARFYQIDTNRPIFSGRDGVIRYALAEIEPERRDGYAWYGRWGEEVSRRHKQWRVRQGLPTSPSLTPPTPGP